MSQELISRSPDLKRLRDEGYDVNIVGGYLVLRHIPYATQLRQVSYGSLVSRLDLAGDRTARPGDHVVMFAGVTPCDQNGVPLQRVINSSSRQSLGEGLVIDHVFSSKPAEGYSDYYLKMTAYVRILAHEAIALDESATPTPFLVVQGEQDDSIYRYIDTASSRAGIGLMTAKLAVSRVAIVGLGGTGSYILDLIAKTPVREIHLFDGDRLLQHNAFRAPGAASIDELRGAPYKVNYYFDVYSKLRRGIVPHSFYVDESHFLDVSQSDFVFLALDAGASKAHLVDHLTRSGVSFIDVGMGLYEVDGCLSGQLRVVTSLSTTRERSLRRIPLDGADGDAEYDRNIQIADLNALNAALAVIKWKKLCGFYLDLEGEEFTVYQLNGNCLINEDLR